MGSLNLRPATGTCKSASPRRELLELRQHRACEAAGLLKKNQTKRVNQHFDGETLSRSREMQRARHVAGLSAAMR